MRESKTEHRAQKDVQQRPDGEFQEEDGGDCQGYCGQVCGLALPLRGKEAGQQVKDRWAKLRTFGRCRL